MKRKDLQSFVQEYCCLFQIGTVEIVQQYSMRSYEDGKYNIRSDGNLRSILNTIDWIYEDLNFIITVPRPEHLKNGEDDIKWLLSQNGKISVRHADYHENALQNRLNGIDYTPSLENLVITYFDVEPHTHSIFLCPGSPRGENPTYNMEELPWFKRQVKNSVATFFFNKNQNILGWPQKCFEIEGIVEEVELWRIPQLEEQDLKTIRKIDLYFPYRLTDRDYDFQYWLSYAVAHGLRIGVTDPNNSLETLKLTDNVRDLIVKLDPSKHWGYLRSLEDEKSEFKIIWASDLRKTLHMGPVEMASAFYSDFYDVKMLKEIFIFNEKQFNDEDIEEIFSEVRRALDW